MSKRRYYRQTGLTIPSTGFKSTFVLLRLYVNYFINLTENQVSNVVKK